MDGPNWKVERQVQHSLSQSSTRVLQSQNIRVSTNFRQVKFPLIMEENTWRSEGSESNSNNEMELLKKKMMERMSFDMPMPTLPMSNNFPSLLNGSQVGVGGASVSEMISNSKEGFSLTREMKAMKMEQAQVQFSSTRTSSLQQNQQLGSIQSQRMLQGLQQGSVGMPMPTSNSWVTNMNLNRQGEHSSRKEMTSSSTISSSSSCASATATSSAMGIGVTRSFSSSSGFPPTSMSSGSINSDGGDCGQSNALVHNNFPKFGGSASLSPFRRPFGFRNFDRPLWTDIPFNAKDNHGNNRMTWDPAMMLSMKTSSSQVQFSASQHTFFEASNGSFRAFKDQRVFLRQSYGASESESENDEDDDSDYDLRSIGYRQKQSLPYKPKLAITEKPHYEPSETDDTSSVVPSDFEISPRDSFIDTSLPSTPEHRKCFKVAQELLTTERTYVKILHLIDQIFHFRVDQDNRVQQMFPPETITQIFCNIKSLYRLHNDHLLPKLEERLAKWEENPKIGDIMTNFAPFLKMYSEYVQNFDNSINLINIYREKSARFRQIIDDIQKLEECGNLPIQHHLIGPIQRIPRYRLLLEAYLRRLPDDSPDRPETEKALEIVSKAAEHANEAMRRIVGFKKLLEVQEKVKGVVDLVSPTRLLIKEGKVCKISARTGDHQERYMFLFSDLLLLCSSRPMNKMISIAPYQLRAKLDVGIITVAEGDDLEVVNTFYVEDNHKKIELYTSTPFEKSDWMTAIHKTREELLERKSSLRLGSASPTEDELGLKEPAKLKSDSVSKCMECYAGFTMLKRRHHCHACGIVICGKCSDSKVPLQYAGGKPCRVCKRCRTILAEKHAVTNNTSTSSEATTPDETMEKLRGVLDVPGYAPSCLNGALHLRLRGKKEWILRWFALRSDFVLYCYTKEADEMAMTATPIPGMSVLMVEDLSKSDMPNLANNEKDRTFRISHGQGHKTYFFLAANRETALQWVQKLNLAAKAELQNGTGAIPSANNDISN